MRDRDWLTLAQAAAHVQLHPATLRRSAKSGKLRAFKVNNARLWRFRREDVDAWLLALDIDRQGVRR